MESLTWDDAELYEVSSVVEVRYDDVFALVPVNETVLRDFFYVMGMIPPIVGFVRRTEKTDIQRGSKEISARESMVRWSLPQARQRHSAVTTATDAVVHSFTSQAISRVLTAMSDFLADAEGPLAKNRRKIFRNVRLVDALVAAVKAIYRPAPRTVPISCHIGVRPFSMR